MFVIILKYKKPLEIVEKYVEEHRNFLMENYQKGYLIASGPRIPRNGGVILSQLKDRNTLDQIIQKDPFYDEGIADYEIIEFDPVRYHEAFEYFVKIK